MRVTEMASRETQLSNSSKHMDHWCSAGHLLGSCGTEALSEVLFFPKHKFQSCKNLIYILKEKIHSSLGPEKQVEGNISDCE